MKAKPDEVFSRNCLPATVKHLPTPRSRPVTFFHAQLIGRRQNPPLRRAAPIVKVGGKKSLHLNGLQGLPCLIQPGDSPPRFYQIGEYPMRKTLIALAATTLLTSPVFAAGHGGKNIVETAIEAGSFTTLVAAVEAAGLVETLTGEGPFTVFAPTDEAFAALPAGTVENLLLPENRDQLVAILTYHVVPGAVKSTDLTDGMTATTVQGGDITIDLDNGVMVNDATVVSADIEASNGIIHVIDAVIMPPM
jgi:uncharacterized surface protein with fasciclin (FAS1) repeats